MSGRTVAYCYDCKKDLCKPNIRECAEDTQHEHVEITGHAVGLQVVTKHEIPDCKLVCLICGFETNDFHNHKGMKIHHRKVHNVTSRIYSFDAPNYKVIEGSLK